jgi:serine/threonine-protein kinase
LVAWQDRTTEIPDEWLTTVEGEPPRAESPGRYDLGAELASGGMATVYLARYRGAMGLERIVAVKKVHPHLAREQQFVDMFLDEARIAARIDHPYVCRVLDCGEMDDSYFLAMEYLAGEPLSEVFMALAGNLSLASSPRRPLLVARLIADLCEGLHAAHELRDGDQELGIIHRDINPANLFVLDDGTVRIVDFGIAKARNRVHQTETGKVRGTYAYVSPEQLKLESLDRRCDLWSMGIVAWELLTGRRLFRKDSPVDTIHAVTADPIEPPSSVRPEVPPELDGIVMRALQRDPNRRYETARAMASDLEGFLGSRGETVPKAELAGWLEELFPGAADQRLELMARLRRGGAASGSESAEAKARPSEPEYVSGAVVGADAAQSPGPAEDVSDEVAGAAEPVDHAGAGDAAEASAEGPDAADTASETEEAASEPADAPDAAEAVHARESDPGEEFQPTSEFHPKSAESSQSPQTPPTDGAPPSSPAQRAASSGPKAKGDPRKPRRGRRVLFLAAAALACGAAAAVVWGGPHLGVGRTEPQQRPQRRSASAILDEASSDEGSSAAGTRSERGAASAAAGDPEPGSSGGSSAGEADSFEPARSAPQAGTGSSAGGSGSGELKWRSVNETGAGGDTPSGSSQGDSPEHERRHKKTSGDGSVHVTTPGGWAEVRVDGKSYGRTPATLDLEAGPYQVELYPYGNDAKKVLDVNVREGRQVVLSVTIPSKS